MLTLNAVPSRLVLRSTIGAMPSSSSRLATTGMHDSPVPWRVMKLMCSGVTSWAATTRSPSFSRSSSSTMITNLPASKSAIASGTVARLMAPLILPVEVSGHVAGHDIGFEVDDRAGFVGAGDRDLESVRDEGDLERACWLVHRHHGEAYAIHSYRAPGGDKPGQRGGKLDCDLASAGGRYYPADNRRSVDVPWTRWPSSSEVALKGSSRLTSRPTRSPLRFVRRKVSGTTSAKKTGPFFLTTVKQQPLTATLPPTFR